MELQDGDRPRAGPELGTAELAGGRSSTRSISASTRPKRRSRRSQKAEGRRRDRGVTDEAAIRRAADDSIRAMMLIRTYRVRGHLAARLDPLGLMHRELPADLTPAYHGFADADLDRKIWLGGTLGFQEASIRQILPVLQATYCGTVGFEYMHINDLEERRFIQDRIEERGRNDPVHARGQAVDPRKGDPRRAVGKIPRQEICRDQAVRPRRRRERDSRRLKRSSNMAGRWGSTRSPSACPTAAG